MNDSFAPGGTFGAYRIERLLGRGGMSTVYLAEHTGLKRKVALKVLAPELAADERFRERFVRESQLAASLDEPNVLPVYEADEHDGVLFIAMRYVDGTDLRGLIEERALTPERTVTVLEQVARALDAAHAKGLVHRDVKPGNILVARASGSAAPEHIYLSDFGLTKRSSSSSGLTGTGVFVGTLDYAAPEQFEGRPLDARTDIYSLGCVAFECLTGSPPYRREQDAALMYAHLNEPPPRATAVRPELPPTVDEVIRTAMAKQPQRRYASAGAFATAFREALEPGGEGRPGSRRPRGALIAGAVALIALVLGLAVVLTRSDGNGSVDASASGPSASASAAAPPPSSLVRIDPETSATTATIPDVPGLGLGTVTVAPNLAVGEGGLWVYGWDRASPGFDGFLAEFDLGSGDPIGQPVTIRIVPGTSAELTVGSRTVWLIGAEDPTVVSRFNPATQEPLDPVSVDGSTTDIVLGDGVLWVGSSDGTLTGFDPLTGSRSSQTAVDVTPDALAFADGSLWVLDFLGEEVVRVDPIAGQVLARIPVGGNARDIAAGDGGIWLLDGVAGTVTQIDPATDTVTAPIGVGPDPAALAVGLGSAWVADAENGKVYPVDPVLGLQTPIDVGGPLGAIVVDDGAEALWVAVLEP